MNHHERIDSAPNPCPPVDHPILSERVNDPAAEVPDTDEDHEANNERPVFIQEDLEIIADGAVQAVNTTPQG